MQIIPEVSDKFEYSMKFLPSSDIIGKSLLKIVVFTYQIAIIIPFLISLIDNSLWLEFKCHRFKS